MASNIQFFDSDLATTKDIHLRNENDITSSNPERARPLLALIVIPIALFCVSIAIGAWYYKKSVQKRLERQKANDAAERVRSRAAWHWLAEERMKQHDRAEALAMLEGRIPENKTTVRAFGY
ncbi:hypothetical protein Q7P37_009476 [Cladosporium fusiforme]